VVACGALAAFAALWLPPALPPLAALGLRMVLTVATFAALLSLSGFFRRSERAFIVELTRRLRKRTAVLPDVNAD
jgi:CHASE2 domain-containing sensor protein